MTPDEKANRIIKGMVAAGTAAQHYFKGQTSHDELRAVVRGAVAEARRTFTTTRETK
jgi:hypothetical protein